MKNQLLEIIADLDALELRMLPNRSFTSNQEVADAWGNIRTKLRALLPDHHVMQVQSGTIGGATRFVQQQIEKDGE